MGNRRQGEFALECVARMLEAKDSPMHLEAAKLRAELDALNAEPAATETPALARFLPRRPADSLVGLDWAIVKTTDNALEHTAIRWDAAPDIWHRFGLLAPSEGGGWIPHRPGDAMPCEGRCQVLLKGEIDDAQFRHQPGEVVYGTAWCWGADHSDNNIIGWRPVIAEVAK
jgi:hypothetical protein